MLHCRTWRQLVLALNGSGWAVPQTLLRPTSASLSIPTNGAGRSPSMAAYLAPAPGGELLLVLSRVTGPLSDIKTSFAAWMRP